MRYLNKAALADGITFVRRYWFLSCSVGFGVFIAILFLAGVSDVTEPLAYVLLFPGIALAGVMGFGAHDLDGAVLYFIGNIIFYSLLVLVLLRVLKVGSESSGTS